MLIEHAFDSGRLFEGTFTDGHTLFARGLLQARSTLLARSPTRRSRLSCLLLWLEQTGKDVEWLENRLYTCHISRRIILPHFSIDVFKREIDKLNHLFKIDLEVEAKQFEQMI